ncbi:MAG: hypothetical protein ACLR13_10765 [Acutalibacteraceae bacterium]
MDDYIDLMDELESNKKEMAEMTADAEEYSAEERDELQEYINELQKEIDYYWGKFLERKRQKESYVFEKEIENIMAWKSRLIQFSTPKIHSNTLLASIGEMYPLVSFSHLLARCTGATPPNTLPNSYHFAKRQMTVPQTAQQN